MIRKLWNFGDVIEIGNFGCEYVGASFLKDFTGISPPPPYSKEDLQNYKHQNLIKGKVTSYSDVGEEIYVTIRKTPNEVIGLTILSGEAFRPCWPTILDIKGGLPASQAEEKLLIGDQIKELNGIPTESLTHLQVLSLFSKATDEITMTVRRGIEPSDRSFDWYKHPFSSVSRTFDDILVLEHNINSSCNRPTDMKGHLLLFKSFRAEDDCDNNSAPQTTEKSTKNQYTKHVRSLSASAVSKRNFISTPRERRKTTDHTNMKCQYIRSTDLIIPTPSGDGKFISDEIEKLSSSKISNHIYDSQNSLSSTLSASTVSSFSDCSNGLMNDQNRRLWMDHVSQTVNTNPEADVFSDSPLDIPNNRIKNMCKSPVNMLRNSFRRKKGKKENDDDLANENGKSVLKYHPVENTIMATVWIADRKRLGLKLGGGSVSPYGDSNIRVRDIKKTGTAYKVFRIGDEILEIDGVPTNGMDVYEANGIISKLEGNYVEFKVFRPSNKT